MSLSARTWLHGPHLRLIMPARLDTIRARTMVGSIVEITLYEVCPPNEPRARWHSGLGRWLVGREIPDRPGPGRGANTEVESLPL